MAKIPSIKVKQGKSEIDDSSEDFKRLIKYNGLQITNITRNSDGIVIIFKRDNEEFKGYIPAIVLLDKNDEVIDRCFPKVTVITSGITGVHIKSGVI